MTAEALNTMINPTNTNTKVTMKSQRSTLMRFAMKSYFTTEIWMLGEFLVSVFEGKVTLVVP